MSKKSRSRKTASNVSLSNTLLILRTCCEEALSGKWDRSNAGFEDMIALVDQTLAANTNNNTLHLDACTAKALRALVRYVYEQEAWDYAATEADGRPTHIYNDIRVLALACGEVTAKELADFDADLTSDEA